MSGGGGLDAVDYSDRTANLTVNLDGSPGDDGEAGEGDTVGADVEGIFGGAGNDTLTGNAADGFLSGGPGDDELIDPGGQDIVDGGDGNDDLQTRDGAADDDRCGDGFDTVVGDPIDSADFDCESLDGPPGPPEGTGGGGSPGPVGILPRPRPIRPPRVLQLPDRVPPHATVAIAATRRLSSLRAHGLRLRISCDERCSAQATLTLIGVRRRRAHASGIGAGRVTLPAADTARSVRIGLNRSAKRHLRRAATARFVLRVTVFDVAGNHRALRRNLSFRA